MALTKRPKATAIKTTLMELLDELTRSTKDDAMVMATIKNIFASYRVRLARSWAPVRIVNDDPSQRGRRLTPRAKGSAWA